MPEENAPSTASSPEATSSNSSEGDSTPGQVVAPTPEEYQMPDDYASASPLDKVARWAESNPGLALLAAGGIGAFAHLAFAGSAFVAALR